MTLRTIEEQLLGGFGVINEGVWHVVGVVNDIRGDVFEGDGRVNMVGSPVSNPMS